MASTKQTAKKPEDLDVDVALDEVVDNSKRVVADGAAAKLAERNAEAAALANSTFAERAKAFKRVGSALNKAVKSDETEAK